MAEESGPQPSKDDERHLRFLRRQEEQQTQREERAKERMSKEGGQHSAQTVLARISEVKDTVQRELAQIERDIENAGTPGEELVKSCTSQLSDLSKTVNDLSEDVAEHSALLSSYDRKQALQTVAQLFDEIDSTKDKVTPRKKFSFGARRKRTELQKKASSKNETEKENGSVATNTDAAVAKGYSGTPQPDDCLPRGARAEVAEAQDGGGKSALRPPAQSPADEDVDAVLQKLGVAAKRQEKCLENLRGETIILRPDENSKCLIDGRFFLQAGQIRLHDTTASDFWLRVRSGPIIEDCSNVRFAPFPASLAYPGLQEQREKAGLDRENDMWSKVNDFKWLKMQQSPNWSLMPPEEETATIDDGLLQMIAA